MQLTVAFATTLVVPALLLADDFKLSDGRKYKYVTVARAEPDGLVVNTKVVNDSNI
jgi:hypothetical protein